MPPKKTLKPKNNQYIPAEDIPQELRYPTNGLLRSNVTGPVFQAKFDAILEYVESVCFKQAAKGSRCRLKARKNTAATSVAFESGILNLFIKLCSQLSIDKPAELRPYIEKINEILIRIFGSEPKIKLLVESYTQLFEFYKSVLLAEPGSPLHRSIPTKKMVSFCSNFLNDTHMDAMFSEINEMVGACSPLTDAIHKEVINLGTLSMYYFKDDSTFKFSESNMAVILIRHCERFAVQLDTAFYSLMLSYLYTSIPLELSYIFKCLMKIYKNGSSLEPQKAAALSDSLRLWLENIRQNPQLAFVAEQIAVLNVIYSFIATRFQIELNIQQIKPYLDVFTQHSNMVDGRCNESLYLIANALLKQPQAFPEALTVEESFIFDSIFSLLSRDSASTDLSKIRLLYEQMCQAYRDVHQKAIPYLDGIHASLLKLLPRAHQFSVSDYLYLYQEIESRLEPAQARGLMSHLLKKCDPHEEAVLFFKHQFETIQTDVNLLNLFLRKYHAFVSTINHPECIAYDALDKLIKSCEESWCIENHPNSKQMIDALDEYMASLTIRTSDDVLPSEKLSGLHKVLEQCERFQRLRQYATKRAIKINRFYIEFSGALRDRSLEQLELVYTACQQEISKVEQDIAEAVAKTSPSIEQAKLILASRSPADIERLNRLFVVDENHLESYLVKIRCLIALGYFDEAIGLLGEVKPKFSKENQSPLFALWAQCCRARGRYLDALKISKDLAQKTQRNGKKDLSAQLFVIKDLILLAQPASLQEALDLCDELLSQTITDKQLFSRLMMEKARCLSQLGRGREAEDLLKALPHFGKDPWISFSLSHIARDDRRFKEARQWLNTCLQQSDVILVKKQHAHVPLMIEKYDDESHSEQTKKQMIATVHLYKRRKDYSKALEVLSYIEEKWGYHIHICTTKAQILRLNGNYEDAIKVIKGHKEFEYSRLLVLTLALTYGEADQKSNAYFIFDFLFDEYASYLVGYFHAIQLCAQWNDHNKMEEYWQLFQKNCPDQSTSLYQEMESMMHAARHRESEKMSSIMEAIDELEEQETVETIIEAAQLDRPHINEPQAKVSDFSFLNGKPSESAESLSSAHSSECSRDLTNG